MLVIISKVIFTQITSDHLAGNAYRHYMTFTLDTQITPSKKKYTHKKKYKILL